MHAPGRATGRRHTRRIDGDVPVARIAVRRVLGCRTAWPGKRPGQDLPCGRGRRCRAGRGRLARAMSLLGEVYRPPLALLTDLYQLTMAQGYRQAGKGEVEGVFHLFFRNSPFGGGFAVACGLSRVLEFVEGFRFGDEDVAYLARQSGNDGQPLFAPSFLGELRSLRLECDVDAIPEGTVVFPFEPLVRVRGRLLQAQLLETALLNFVNFETLIATKAARVTLAARGDQVIDLGLRRAQGIDGGLSASRAAFVGGCAATSNVLAGRLLGLPVTGTHAHSWVMAFDSEEE